MLSTAYEPDIQLIVNDNIENKKICILPNS